MLDDGVIKFSGAPAEVLSSDESGFTLSFDGSVNMKELLAILAEKNIVPVKAEKNEMSLEELFVKETGR